MIKINPDLNNDKINSAVRSANVPNNFEKEVMDKIKEYNNDLLDLNKKDKQLSSADKLSELGYTKKNPLLEFNPQLELMRISAAESIPALKRVIISLENHISMLKNVKEAETLIPKIKRILKKGYQKIDKLEIEKRIERAITKAHKKREYVKESNHRNRLAARKIHRKKQEAEDIKNANNIANGCEETVPQLTTLASDYISSQNMSAELAAAVENTINTAAGVETANDANTANIAIDISV